jgi:copper transport protein
VSGGTGFRNRLVAGLGTLLTGWAVLMAAVAAPASAHASVVATDPLDGARLASVPAMVTVTFDESVSLGAGYLKVTDSSARAVDDGRVDHPGAAGTTLSVPLKAGLSDGSYVVSWRVVSADSHVVSGSIRFVVGNGPLASAGAAGTSDAGATRSPGIGALAVIARLVGFAGLFLLGGLWVLFLAPIGARAAGLGARMAWAGWGGATVGAVGDVLVQGAQSSGRGIGSLLSAAQIDQALGGTYGQLRCWSLIGLGLIGLLLPAVLRSAAERRTHGAPEAALVLYVGVLCTLSGSGHAASASPRVLALAADVAHLCAAGAWLGGLAFLAVVLLPSQDPLDAHRAARSFSPVAAGAIAVLLGTGVYQSWREVRSVPALLDTTYGRLVLIKLALLIAIVVAAAASRRWASGRSGTRAAPRRGLIVELALGVAALLAAATLVGEPPAAAAYAQAQSAKPASATADLGGGRSARVTIDPARHGLVSLSLQISGGNGSGAPISAPLSVTLSATLAAAQLGPIAIPLSAAGGGASGQYSAADVALASAGRWVFALSVRLSTFDAVTADLPIRVG